MRVLVCGGRAFNNAEFLFRKLDELHRRYHFDAVIHGDARGADRLAGEWAKANGVLIEAHPARWHTGKDAGIKRNRQMLQSGPALVIAFRGGSGTAHMVRIAENAGVKVLRIGWSDLPSAVSARSASHSQGYDQQK